MAVIGLEPKVALETTSDSCAFAELHELLVVIEKDPVLLFGPDTKVIRSWVAERIPVAREYSPGR